MCGDGCEVDKQSDESNHSISPIFLATLEKPEVAEKVKRIKVRCEAERKEAESKQSQNKESTSVLTKMMGIVSGDVGKLQAWRKMSIAIDSGAAEIVIPHTMVTEYPIQQTEKSESGACYASATGEPIPNLGEQRLPLATAEGSLRAMTFQAAPVAKPLGSVMRICQAGHLVVFDSDGSYIFNKQSCEINWLREEHGNYMLDVWVPPAEQVSPNTWQRVDHKQPFGRQP